MKTQLILLVALVTSLVACSKTSEADKQTLKQLSGEVYYLQRKMLPPDALLTVTLEDVSKMDVASTVLATSKQTIAGAPPYAFSLEYDAAQIQDKMRYSLRATVNLNDQLLMTTTQAFDPFKGEGGPIELKLSMVPRTTSAALTQAQQTPDTGLAVVSVRPLASLDNTYWKLLSLGGQAVIMSQGQKREAYIQLQANDLSLKGFAGCNQLMGSYTVQGNDLSFAQVGVTRKACSVGMDMESGLLQTLQATRYFSIHEHVLTLLNDDKKPIARFEAQYFN